MNIIAIVCIINCEHVMFTHVFANITEVAPMLATYSVA